MPRLRSSSLKNLQTLWGLFLDDFSAIKNGLNKLTKLGLEFCLELSSQQNALVKWVKGLKYLKSLRLRSVGENGEALDLYLENISELNNLSSLYLFGKQEDQSIKSLFPNIDYFCLSDFTLSALGFMEDPMPTLGSLPKLKSLCFHVGSFKGKEMVCLGKGFPELLVLKLWKLESLEELQVEERAMQKLRELDIRCCNKLKVPTRLKHLKSLQELKLRKFHHNNREKEMANLGRHCPPSQDHKRQLVVRVEWKVTDQAFIHSRCVFLLNTFDFFVLQTNAKIFRVCLDIAEN